MMKKLIIITNLFLGSLFIAQNYSIAELPEDLKKDANAVVRNYSFDINIKSQDNMEYKVKKVISILNKAADNFSSVYISYDKSTRISDVKIRVLDENGKQVKTYSKSDLHDISQSNDNTLYSDDRALAMKIEQVNYPYTIDLSYTTRTSDTAFLPYLQPFYGANVSVEKWSMDFKNDSGIKLRNKVTKSYVGVPEVYENANTLGVTFKNVSAINLEKHAPDTDVLFSKVEFALDKACLKGKCGDFSTWQNLAKWYNTLLEPVSEITPEIQKEINSLNLSGTTTEKVKKIYQYMQSKTRYIFVAIGIGGWQPMVADDVRKKAYGDCKALTNYMRVLLKAAGIKSYYAKIYMDSTPVLFDENFPKMGGNHVILYIPTDEGDIWLENTSQNIAFNHLGYSTRNRNVVLIDDKESKIIKTPVYNPNDSKEVLHFKGKISENNSLVGTSTFLYTGSLYDWHLRKMSLSSTEIKESLKEEFAYMQFSSLDYKNLKNDRDNGALSFDVAYKAENFSKSLGNDIYFRAIPLSDIGFYLDTSEKRKFPLEVSFAYTDSYEIEYELPNGYKITDLPVNKTVNSEYGLYTINFLQKDNKIIVNRTFTLNKSLIPVEKIPNYVSFRKQINRIDATKILITKI